MDGSDFGRSTIYSKCELSQQLPLAKRSSLAHIFLIDLTSRTVWLQGWGMYGVDGGVN
jgi:hypothetical protein